MQSFSPFVAGMFNDPDSDPDDGVLDVSRVLSISDGDPHSPMSLAQSSTWRAALAAGNVVHVDESAFYLVRAGYQADEVPRQFAGVVGASGPATSILAQPTTVLVSESAFPDLLIPEGMPLIRASHEGWHFRVWPIRRAGIVSTIAEAVIAHAPDSTSPFVLATNEFFTLAPGILFFGSCS